MNNVKMLDEWLAENKSSEVLIKLVSFMVDKFGKEETIIILNKASRQKEYNESVLKIVLDFAN